jgi:hypothetical protein
VLVAAQILGFETVTIGNIFSLPTNRTGDISVIGGDPGGWMDAREELESQLRSADGVLLGYGCKEPSGIARQLHRNQVAWLDEQLDHFRQDVWWVGGQPRHPSRWQRHTSRLYPEMPFLDALHKLLQPRASGAAGSPIQQQSPCAVFPKTTV